MGASDQATLQSPLPGPVASRMRRANALRALAMDAVERARSGHPGMPMGMADIAEVLWNDYLVHNPANPRWLNRDRFVLSNGHGSMLLYALLHLTGYDVSIDELSAFDNSVPRRRVIRKWAALRESKQRPAPLVRDSPTRLGWRSPNAPWRTSSTGLDSRLSITTRTFSSGTDV